MFVDFDADVVVAFGVFAGGQFFEGAGVVGGGGAVDAFVECLYSKCNYRSDMFAECRASGYKEHYEVKK